MALITIDIRQWIILFVYCLISIDLIDCAASGAEVEKLRFSINIAEALGENRLRFSKVALNPQAELADSARPVAPLKGSQKAVLHFNEKCPPGCAGPNPRRRRGSKTAFWEEEQTRSGRRSRRAGGTSKRRDL